MRICEMFEFGAEAGLELAELLDGEGREVNCVRKGFN